MNSKILNAHPRGKHIRPTSFIVPMFSLDPHSFLSVYSDSGEGTVVFDGGSFTPNYMISRGFKMTVKPLQDRVLIKVEEAETKTASGLYIPDTAQEKTQTGTVIAVGDDEEMITVKVGDKVMYDKYAGTTVKIDDVDHLIVKSSDILAVVS
jgi:chaperonin GroES